MKKIITIIVSLLLATPAFAQHLESDTISNVKRMLNQKGTMLKKEFGDVIRRKTGTNKSPGSCKYELLFITDLESGVKTGGLRITAYGYDMVGSSLKTYDYIAYLDPDEIIACVSFLKKVSTEYINTAPDKYTEMVYMTSDGFRIGCFYDPKDKSPAWKVFLQTKNYTDKSFVAIDKDDLNVLIEDFENAYNSILSFMGK
ncbi:MAG: hypothetical protein K5882_01010 [Bacteroidales bacterium]|nr:hypothetical protein [Bacteroidales bacterium]